MTPWVILGSLVLPLSCIVHVRPRVYVAGCHHIVFYSPDGVTGWTRSGEQRDTQDLNHCSVCGFDLCYQVFELPGTGYFDLKWKA